MLRSIFVVLLMALGLYYMLQGPFYALLAYLAYSYFRPEQWLWTNIIPPNFSFALGVYVILASVLSGQRVVLNKRIILISIFLLQTLISLFLSEYFVYGWWGWKNFCKSVLITYLIVVLVTDFVKFRLALLILVLFLGVESAKQGWVYLITSPGWGANTNTIPFLGDNNAVAVGMLMLAPIVGFLAQTTQHKWLRMGFWLLLIGVLFRALSTYSRGGFLACIALGGAYWLRSRQKLRTLLGLVLIAAILVPALSQQYWERMDTITADEEEQDSSAKSRLHFWRVAVEMANANPLLGVGHLCYNVAYNAYDFLQGTYGLNRSVHSSFFGILAETGYVGAALYCAIIFSALRSCRRVSKLDARTPTLLALRQSAIALETSLIAFLVGGSFLPFQYNEMLWHYIGFTIVLERLAAHYTLASDNAEDTSVEIVSVGPPVIYMGQKRES